MILAIAQENDISGESLIQTEEDEMVKKKSSQKELIDALRRLDGTILVTDPILRGFQRDVLVKKTLTGDDEIKAVGLLEELKMLQRVANDAAATLEAFLKTHEFE